MFRIYETESFKSTFASIQ